MIRLDIQPQTERSGAWVAIEFGDPREATTVFFGECGHFCVNVTAFPCCECDSAHPVLCRICVLGS